MKKIVCLLVSASILLTSLGTAFAERPSKTKVEKTTILEDSKKVKKVESVDEDGNKAVATYNKESGILTVMQDGKVVSTLDTNKIDKKFKEKAEEMNKLSKEDIKKKFNETIKKNPKFTGSKQDKNIKSPDTSNSSLIPSNNNSLMASTSSDGWNWVRGNADIYWGFGYNQYRNGSSYCWDVTDSYSWKTVYSNATSCKTYASSVDSLVSNEYYFMLSLNTGASAAALAFIFSPDPITKSAFMAGLASLGITGTVARFAWDVNVSARNCYAYYDEIVADFWY